MASVQLIQPLFTEIPQATCGRTLLKTPIVSRRTDFSALIKQTWYLCSRFAESNLEKSHSELDLSGPFPNKGGGGVLVTLLAPLPL